MSYDACIRCGQLVHGPDSLCAECDAYFVSEYEIATLGNMIIKHGQREAEFDRWWQQVQAYAEQRGCAWVLTTKEDHRDGFNKGRKPEFEVEEQLNAAFYSR